jgi:flagellar motor switch protein FliM
VSKFLNQDEIDRIVSEANAARDASGVEPDPSAVRRYDADSPGRAAQEIVRLVHAVHEAFQYGLVSAMAGQLRVAVEVDLLGVEPMSFHEYSLSLNNPSVLGVFDLDKSDAEAVFEIQPPLAAAMIERLFGGEGDSPTQVRELTPIEHAVMERTVRNLLNELEQAWQDVGDVSLALRRVERNPQFIQTVAPNEIVLLTTFEVRVGAATGLITVTYPQSVLEPIANERAARNGAQRVRSWETLTGAPLAARMRDVPLPLVARLGSADVSVGELTRLAVGDVVRLDRRVGDEIDVEIGNVAKLRARPGVRHSRRALMITRVEQDDNDE